MGVRFISLACVVAIITNIMAMNVLGIRTDIYRLAARMILILVLVPGLFSSADIKGLIRGSRVINYIFRINKNGS